MGAVRGVVGALAAVVLAGAAGCSTGSQPGGDDPRAVIGAGAEPIASGGSARVRESFSLSGMQPLTAEGVVSWKDAGGSTGDLTSSSLLGNGPTRTLFTEDALYIETAGAVPPGLSAELPGLAGKKWIRRSYTDITRDFGPLGQVLTAAIDRTNPVRDAALLSQSPDLREVGTEQVDGVTATHYAGTIRFTDAVEDLRLGLSREVLDALRREIAAAGASDEQQYDLWVDEQGRPVRAQGRLTDATGPQSYSVDYGDYAGPRPVQAPPAGEVVDGSRLLAGLGPPPR